MSSLVNLLPGHADPEVVLWLALVAVVSGLLITSWVLTR